MLDTWDLTKFYRNIEEFSSNLHKIQKSLTKAPFAIYKHKLHQAKSLKAFLDRFFDLHLELDWLYTYSQLKLHEDLSNSQSQQNHQMAKVLYVDFESQSSFWKSELLAMKKAPLAKLIKHTSLKMYRHLLERLLQFKDHTLSDKEEKLLTLMEKPLGHVPAAFEAMNNVDLDFGKIKDGKGKLRPLTHGLYLTYLQAPDRMLRKNAWYRIHESFKKVENTLSHLLISHVEKHNFIAQSRNYSNALNAAIHPNFIDEKVYYNLIDATHSGLRYLHDYLNLKKKILKIKTIHPYDVYSLGSVAGKKTPYSKAKEYVIESVKDLGKEYQQKLSSALNQERWVDVFERKYKRSSAYSSGSFNANPYVLLNYCGSLSDVFTLSHEMGHSMHSFYTWKTQSYPYASYPIFLAEIASTFHEQLLFDTLLEVMTKKEEKIQLLMYSLEQLRATFFRQTMFAEFEANIHEISEKKPLTVQEMNAEYYRLNQQYFGKGVTLDQLIEVEWARIPHFYSNFYVYQYATGIAAALNLHHLMKTSKGFTKKYLTFLSSGSSKYPLDLLKDLGVDFTTKKPIQITVQVFKERLQNLKKLF